MHARVLHYWAATLCSELAARFSNQSPQTVQPRTSCTGSGGGGHLLQCVCRLSGRRLSDGAAATRLSTRKSCGRLEAWRVCATACS